MGLAWATAVLAAGKGTRMRSRRPKVLHELAGRPLVDHVLDLAQAVTPSDRIVVVVGHGADLVRAHVLPRGVRTVLQEPQLGTGDAVRTALAAVDDQAVDGLLVLSGDVPLLQPRTVERLCERLEAGAGAALLTAILDEPGAYGRVVRAPDRSVRAIVEARDATAAELALREVNAGVYAFRLALLRRALAGLRPDNAQAEYYLTDVVAALVAGGATVGAEVLEDADEMLGVNDRTDLARLEAILAARAATGEAP